VSSFSDSNHQIGYGYAAPSGFLMHNDNVRLYNRDLSATEVSTLYNETKDDFLTNVCCTDVDGDGYGIATNNSGCSKTGADCDDNNAAINPGATEVCNSMDDNCDDKRI